MNAKKELLLELANTAKIKCATIAHYRGREASLKVNHTEEEYKEFIDSLDFDYYDGYGSQELFGIVWLSDGTWLSRVEYDGSEWWKHNYCPEIPYELYE